MRSTSRLALFFFAAICLCQSCVRKPDVREDFVTSPNAQIGQSYPMVNSEGRVRVCIHAPYALSVKLDICAVKYPLRRVDGGLWIGESAPLDEGFHYYQIQIDGASMPDPSSLYYYGAGRWGSGVDVPSPDQEIYEVRNVPHGQVREIRYWSDTKQSMRRVNIYTPPGYDQSQSKRYPVLYLLPGGAENEDSWIQQGHLAQIMDNLIADGKAEPFIVVTDNCIMGHPFDWEEEYDSIITEDLIPMVDSNFKTVPDNAHRAMAGFSYGGFQSKWTTMAHPDLFSYVGFFCGGILTVDELKDNQEFTDGIRLVFVSYGGNELNGSIVFGIDEGVDPRKETEALKEHGVNLVYYVSPNTHHEWHSCRRSLYRFAQLLFKTTT